MSMVTRLMQWLLRGGSFAPWGIVDDVWRPRWSQLGVGVIPGV